MRALFNTITAVERWLRQRYPRDSRVFWNQIMTTCGIIMLKQESLPVTIGNMERYTPIPSSSIHRTFDILKAYGIITDIGGETYDFKGDVPKDILELSTKREAIEINGIVSELRAMMKGAVSEALHGLNLGEEQIATVTERLDKVRPKVEKLDALSELVGQGFLE